MIREIGFPSSEAAKKIESFLKKRFPLGYVKKLFRKKAVRLNGERAKPDTLARPGDRIQLYLPWEKQSQPLTSWGPPPSELQILFENQDMVLVNKPGGLAVHEGKEVLKRRSLIGILENRYREHGIVPKLVHRLDKDTSGVLLIAKRDDFAARMKGLFEKGEVDKQYLCLVVGLLPSQQGQIDFPLPGRGGYTVGALTRFKVLTRFSDTTLVRVKLETGRMHQIRLHFARFGHPVVMDNQHGDFTFNKSFRKRYGLKRQFIHAAELDFEYKGTRRTWTAPLAADLEATIEALKVGSR